MQKIRDQVKRASSQAVPMGINGQMGTQKTVDIQDQVTKWIGGKGEKSNEDH